MRDELRRQDAAIHRAGFGDINDVFIILRVIAEAVATKPDLIVAAGVTHSFRIVAGAGHGDLGSPPPLTAEVRSRSVGAPRP